jgi:hypothetical protein
MERESRFLIMNIAPGMRSMASSIWRKLLSWGKSLSEAVAFGNQAAVE